MTQDQFQSLLARNQPHPVLRRDFMRYYFDNFADAFLPKAHIIIAQGSRVYDGAEIFAHAAQKDTSPYRITSGERPISIVAYTYPKGVEAGEKKSRVMVSENELLIFMELLQSGVIEIHFRFGRGFRLYVEGVGRAAIDLEKRVFRTDATALRRFFQP